MPRSGPRAASEHVGLVIAVALAERECCPMLSIRILPGRLPKGGGRRKGAGEPEDLVGGEGCSRMFYSAENGCLRPNKVE